VGIKEKKLNRKKSRVDLVKKRRDDPVNRARHEGQGGKRSKIQPEWGKGEILIAMGNGLLKKNGASNTTEKGNSGMEEGTIYTLKAVK